MGINTQVSVPTATVPLNTFSSASSYAYYVPNDAPHTVKNLTLSKKEASYTFEFPPVDPSGVYWGVISQKSVPLVNSYHLSRLVFAGQMCIIGHSGPSTGVVYKYSTDGGNTFTDVLGVGLTTTVLYLIASDGTKFYAASSSEIFSSADGINWTKLNSGAISLGTVAGLAVNGTRIVVLNASGAVSVSTDSGATFTAATAISGTINAGTKIVFYGGLFVANAAYSSTMWFIYTSPDGVTWTLRKSFTTLSNPSSTTFEFTIQNNLLFVVPMTSGDLSLWKTADGITWVEHSSSSFMAMSEELRFGAHLIQSIGRGFYGLYYHSGKYLVITTAGAYVTDLSTYFERVAAKIQPPAAYYGFAVTPSNTVLAWSLVGSYTMEYDLANRRQSRLHNTNIRTMVSDIEVEYV